MESQILVEVVNLEKDFDMVEFKRPEVVFAVRVVGVTKVVKYRDRLHQAVNGFGAQRGNAWGHNGFAAAKMLPKFIVKRANAIRV